MVKARLDKVKKSEVMIISSLHKTLGSFCNE